MTETNPFGYFLPSRPRVLVIGSFPCFNGKDYGDWFYSGSGRNHFWQLLSETFGMPVGTLEEKMALCENFGIALTDVAFKIRRMKGNCSDANLKIIEFNRDGIDRCLASGVGRILFTSRYVQAQFYRHYSHVGLPADLLLSPSPAANRHIGGLSEYKDLVKRNLVGSPFAYRLMKYREKFRD